MLSHILGDVKPCAKPHFQDAFVWISPRAVGVVWVVFSKTTAHTFSQERRRRTTYDARRTTGERLHLGFTIEIKF